VTRWIWGTLQVTVAANRVAIPPRLRHKVPALVFMFLSQRLFWTIFGIGTCVFTLFGPVVGRTDHNGYRYLLGPPVCPPAAALFFFLRPFNPYKGFAARLSRMENRDLDPSATRLLEVFRSHEARQFLLRTMVKISGIVFLVMALFAVAFRSSLNWSIISAGFWPGFIGGILGSFIAIGSELIAWGLLTCVRQESP
jgi:hypothetical protein